MTDPSAVTVAGAAATYVQSLPADQRQSYQQELTKFIRWYGGERPIGRLSVGDVDDYVEEVQRSQVDPVLRLTPFKGFLTYAREKELVRTNLAPHVRIRRASGRRPSAAPVSQSQPEVHLTADGFERLRSELNDLVAQRPAIAEELRRAMADKDFRENAPLDATRERQGFVEARIRELEAILRTAQVVEERPVGPRVGLGSTVVVFDVTHGEELRYSLVGPNEANPRKGLISTASPIGRALLERTVGEEFDVAAPVGTIRYRLMSIVPASRS